MRSDLLLHPCESGRAEAGRWRDRRDHPRGKAFISVTHSPSHPSMSKYCAICCPLRACKQWLCRSVRRKHSQVMCETSPAALLSLYRSFLLIFFLLFQLLRLDFFCASSHSQDCFQTKYYSSRPIDWRWLVDGHKRPQSGSLPLKFCQRNLCSPERLVTSFFCMQLEIKPPRNWFILLLQSWVTLPFSYRRQAQWRKGQTQTGWCGFQQGGKYSVINYVFF